MKQIDTRGLACPEPVIKTKRAIDTNEFPLEVLADTRTAAGNIERLARKNNLKISSEESKGIFTIRLEK